MHFPHAVSAILALGVSCLGVNRGFAATAAMGKTADSPGSGARPDPVRSFNRWKKKHSHRQNKKKQLRKQLKKPEWQVEREGISRLMQNYDKVRPALGRGLGPASSWAACHCGEGLQNGGGRSVTGTLPGMGGHAGCHSSKLCTIHGVCPFQFPCCCS